MGEAGVERLVFVLRKCAHVTEYAILAVLIWMALRPAAQSPRLLWDWRAARLALILSAVYAATDEVHQVFVPKRQGSVWDVLLDSFGAACGLGVVWLLGARKPGKRDGGAVEFHKDQRSGEGDGAGLVD